MSRSPYLEIVDGDGVFGAVGENETTASNADWFRVRASIDAPVELPAYCDLLLAGAGYSDTVLIPVLVGDSMNLPAGPDAYGYRIYDYTDSCYSRMPGYDWFELRGVGTRLNLGRDETRPVALPVGFGRWQYYGVEYDTISICSNGWVAAGWTDRVDFVNVALPYVGSPPNIVAVQWDGLDPTAFGSIWYYHDTVGHRFIVEYDSVPYFGHERDWEKVQVQVYDRTVPTPTGDNSIVIQFKTANNFTQATVGLQNRDGTAGLSHCWNNAYPRVSAPLRAGRALRFEPVHLTAVAEPNGPGNLRPEPSVSVSPSHFRSRVVVKLSGVRGPASAGVYTPDGRCVLTLRHSDESGRLWSWDGLDESGRHVTPGVYFIKVMAGSQVVTQKTVLVP